MIKGKRIGVVVPCYNESVLIIRVIETMPAYVDAIVVIDDCSKDNTASVVAEYAKANPQRNVTLLRHEVNSGVGAAISSGYKHFCGSDIDVVAVMAGDAQMDPDDLPAILKPVIEDHADYSKGNRFFSGEAWEKIPKVRFLGNAALSLLTKIASGYWHVADSQSGYTAINQKALSTINWDHMYPRYGQPNDLLVRLNIFNFRVVDVAIRPVYGVGEKSGIKPLRMIPRLSLLIARLFFYRMGQKYIIRDFHPLVFFYFLSFLLLPLGFGLGFYLFVYRVLIGHVAETSVLFSALSIISGLQFMLFAMWMDMDYNKDLK